MRPHIPGARLGLRTALALTTVAAVALGSAATGAGAAPAPAPTNPSADSAQAGGVDTSSAIVQPSLDPLSTAARTKPAPGKKVDFSSATVRSYRAQLTAQRGDFKRWVKAIPFN